MSKTVNNLPPKIPIAFLYADALVCKTNWENNDMMTENVEYLASNGNNF